LDVDAGHAIESGGDRAMSRNASIFLLVVVAILVVAFAIQYIYNPFPELNFKPGYSPNNPSPPK
jgi:hypothetical protein